MYVLHKDDGAITGVITGDKNYGTDLTRVGHQWIYLAEGGDSRAFNFDTMTNYVDVEKKEAGVTHPDCLCNKEQISVLCDKNAIKADGKDFAAISGIPCGAQVTIISDAQIEFEGTVDDGEVELSASDPTIYTVHVTAGAKYMPTSVQIVAE